MFGCKAMFLTHLNFQVAPQSFYGICMRTRRGINKPTIMVHCIVMVAHFRQKVQVKGTSIIPAPLITNNGGIFFNVL